MKRNLIATLMMLFPIVAFGAPDLSAIESAQTMDELKTAYKDAVENARNFATSYLENRQEWVKKVDEMRFPKVYEQDYSIDPSLYVEEDSAQEQSAPATNQTPAPTEPDTPQQTEK